MGKKLTPRHAGTKASEVGILLLLWGFALGSFPQNLGL